MEKTQGLWQRGNGSRTALALEMLLAIPIALFGLLHLLSNVDYISQDYSSITFGAEGPYPPWYETEEAYLIHGYVMTAIPLLVCCVPLLSRWRLVNIAVLVVAVLGIADYLTVDWGDPPWLYDSIFAS